jgi:hypothetical protein
MDGIRFPNSMILESRIQISNSENFHDNFQEFITRTDAVLE